MIKNNIQNYMQMAYDQAKLALLHNEIPVGCIVVKNNIILSSTYNNMKTINGIEHAEILAINEASSKLNSRYLPECDIYITLEPCPMCINAILLSRIKNIYIGATNNIYGGVTGLNTRQGIVNDNIFFGIMEVQCEEILKKYFFNKRNQS